MQFHAIPCNTIHHHAIPCNTMQYHAIPWMLNNCWRSVPLPCGQYMAIFMIVDKAIFYIILCSSNLESAQMICTMWWWGYSSIRVSHAGRRSACWVRSDGTDWKTQLPPHIQPLLSYFTLTFWNRLTPSGNTPRNLVFGRSAEQNTKCGWQKVAEVVKGSSHVNVYC